jgi:hypothetical protein
MEARLEMEVAESALATAGQEGPLSMVGQIGDALTGVRIGDHGADRHPQLDVRAARAVAIRASAAVTVGRLMASRVPVVDQGVDVAVGDRPDAAAASAVPAIRSALRDELFPAERRTAVAAIAGRDFDDGFVDELHDGEPRKEKAPPQAAGPFTRASAAGA